MDNVLCFAAVHDGRIKRSSLEVLSHFRTLAEAHDARLEAVVADSDPSRFVSVLGNHGASRVYLLESDAFGRHLNEPLIRGIQKVFKQSEAGVLAFASTEGAKDILGALGAALNASVLSDVASVDLVEDEWVAERPVMAAKRIARTRATSRPVIVSVRAGSYAAVERPSEAEAVSVSLVDTAASRRPEIRDVVSAASGTVDLSEATVVVAAGRGVKDEEGKQLVDALAQLLGAATGATRAVVESGLYPATSQIGQTGKVVSPELYIGIGISGAIQHVAGMVNSRVIVAINKDADAPIFKYATYGLVGDLYKIVPLFVDELRKTGLG